MRLKFETIKSLTVGAVRIWEEKDGVHFAEMTEKQIEGFYSVSQTLGQRAETTTGIRLDFETNSSFVSFVPLTDGKYEVKVDGLLTRDVAKKGEKQTVNLSKDGKEHRVTLHLPSHAIGGLESVEIEDGAIVKRHVFDMKILFIGDSITQGWNSVYDTMSYAYQTSEKLNADSIIQGTGGAMYNVKTFDKVEGFTPDIVIVAYGTNDSNHIDTLEELGNNSRDYLVEVKKAYPYSKIFVITPIYRITNDEIKPYGDVKLAGKQIQSVAESLDLEVIDGQKMIPHFETFMADNVHPNALGFSVYANNLVDVIKSKMQIKVVYVYEKV